MRVSYLYKSQKEIKIKIKIKYKIYITYILFILISLNLIFKIYYVPYNKFNLKISFSIF